MIIKDLISCDTVNYRLTSMYVAFPYCSFKCDKENGCQLCQNRQLDKQRNYEMSVDQIIQYYDPKLVHAIVCAGLEPLDSFDELLELISAFRQKYNDDIVIYTGYTEDEVTDEITLLKQFSNVYIKFGRFRPNQAPHFDPILGVNLASDNQYAKKIS